MGNWLRSVFQQANKDDANARHPAFCRDPAAMLLLSLAAGGCSRQPSAAYLAACEGPPLGTIERRNQAMEDGYEFNRHFDCIDKASFAFINEQKARWAAANTPEAIARRNEERAKLIADERALKAAAAESQSVAAPQPGYVLRKVDVNTATESELAAVASVGPEVAAQVLEARQKGRFNDWADLVNQVIGLHSAQNAAFASISGLNVNGQSLPGAPPDAEMAAALHKKYQKMQ